MARSTKLTPAKKAGQTRRSRAAFSAKYGSDQAAVVRDLMRGLSTSQVADHHDLCDGSVSATKANLNRWGTFRMMALACNW